jgi:pimeloyl-ACP methyl ester carboxylesterase
MSLNHTIFPELQMPTICPNLGGLQLGNDGITPGLRQHGFDAYVSLVVQQLGNSEHWNDASRIVVAHSFGGMLALHWLTAHCDTELAQIDGLVVISSTPGPMYEQVKVRIPNPWSREWRIAVAPLVPIWNLPMTTKFVKRLMCGGRLDATPVDFRTLDIRSEADLGRAGWRNVDWRALRAYRFTMEGYDVRDRIREITTPTIVLHGTEDSLFAIENARLLSELMPEADLRLVEGADHALPVTHGDEVVRAVTDLLAS